MSFKVYVINEAESLKKDDVRAAVKAIALQVKEHFNPAWGINARVLNAPKDLSKISADGLVFLRDSPPKGADYAGYHDRDTKSGISLGYSFTKISEDLDENWSVTLSHEILELLGNRHVNYYALGPHPTQKRIVMHWLEMCDAVQSQSYEIGKDGVLVSDFLTPLYFTPETEVSKGNHFLSGKLASFGCARGGYLGFWDPKTGKDQNYFADKKAEKRYSIKKKSGLFRRRARLSEISKGF